ncbi:MAG: hypothetical protein LLG20_18550 [Acidobacteriales bacterium]|nr:hypothetical protein [Terriglobales bacterium]
MSSKIERQSTTRRFGSEADVEQLTGFSRRTLQKDRVIGRHRFTWYKVGGKVLYDLNEVEATIRASQVAHGNMPNPETQGLPCLYISTEGHPACEIQTRLLERFGVTKEALETELERRKALKPTTPTLTVDPVQPTARRVVDDLRRPDAHR